MESSRYLIGFCCAWIAVLLAPAGAWAVTFTADTLIAEGDATYDGEDIVVNGCTLTVNGPHPFSSLQVINSGRVTHSAYSDPDEYALELTITGNVTIEPGSSIDANGRGYPAVTGPGAGVSHAQYGTGAGYGGEGGSSYSISTSSPAYGSILQPESLGSGGGNGSSHIGGAGGGVVRLIISGTLQVEGQLSAKGNPPSAGNAGGGSGGSIWLTVGTLAGAGSISANGGNGATWSGGGGGGRIAIYYDADTFSGTRSACGGTGYVEGGAGTLYTKDSGAPRGDLLIANCGYTQARARTPVTTPEAFDLTISDGAIVYPQGALVVHDLHVAAAGQLTQEAEDSTGIEVTVQGDATIDADGSIFADGRGHPAVTGPGAGVSDAQYGTGAGYGGEGGSSNSISTSSPAYGSILQPEGLGSGGGNGSSHIGGAGGGVVRLIISGTLQVEGQLSANGNPPSAGNAGGGSGGSIWLTVGTLTGAGSISARGGNGGTYSGAGAGGRIAIYYDTDTFTGTQSACGGTGYVEGGAGTLYTKASGAPRGDLLIANCGHTQARARTPVTTPEAFDLTISDGAIVYPQAALVVHDLHVAAAGQLTQEAEDSTGIEVAAQGDATIDAAGSIFADGRGHPAVTGPGAGVSHVSYGTGAGYGGEGGSSNSISTSSPAYGLILQPESLGSGGGNGSSHIGGAGGGVVRLIISGTLQVEGQLSANGDPPSAGNAGGGSGGSIWLTVGTLAGAGSISARGGNGGTYSGAGGGGRIAIYYDTDTFTGTQSACGGTGYVEGGAGTIYTKASGALRGDLLIANCGYTQARARTPVTTPEAFNLTISDGAIVYPQGALVVHDLHVAAAGQLTQEAEDSTGIEVAAQGDATIDAAGSIFADGRGHPAVTGPGAGVSHASYGTGAGYGGEGGSSYSISTGSPAYGSILQPESLGSGGGNGSGSTGGAGGGVVRLVVSGSLQVDGELSADGNPPTAGNGGGGSGGSIWLTVGTLAGAGSISVRGGNGGTYSGAGAGGRIAIYHDTDTFTGTQSACGGTGYVEGGAGTIYTKASGAPQGDLLIANCGYTSARAWTPVTTPTAFNLMVGSGAVVHSQEPLVVNDLHLADGSQITHLAGQTSGIDLSALGNVLIDSGGAIVANSRGYAGHTGPGAGVNDGSYGSGAGHGGQGGNSYSGGAGGPAYGLLTRPQLLGSGGGNDSGSTGGPGGGLVRIGVAGSMQLNGQITANGGGPSGGNGGGGSGGSIWVTASMIAGEGTITAHGANGGTYSGGGAGGRIAIYHGGIDDFDVENITVTGGSGYNAGALGTIFLGSLYPPKVVSQNPDGWEPDPVDHVDVTFDAFILAGTFDHTDVSIITPGGPISPGSITVQHIQARSYRIGFPAQSDGDYEVRVGPHITDLYGQEMDQDGDGTPGETPDDVYVGTFHVDTTPLLIITAGSRKTHGTGGTFDVDVLAGTGVECRQNGPTQLIVTFNQNIQGVGGLDPSDVSVTNATVTGVAITDNELEIDLSGALNASVVTITFPGIVDVVDGHPVLGQDTVCLGVLNDDANGDKATNIFDLIQVRNNLNQAVIGANFRSDVNVDNAINIFDLIAIRNNLNKTITGSCP